MSASATRVGVVGGGAWGRSLAQAAARAKSDVAIFSRRELAPMPGVRPVKTYAELAQASELVLFAVPSSAAREVARELGDALTGAHLVVHGVRGLIGERLETVSEVLRQETPVRRVGAIGGPVLVHELEAAAPSVLVAGSRYPEVCDAVVDALGCESVRVYTTPDLVGLEWASALMACLAIAVGYAVEVGIGPGLVAAFISRGVHEAARLAAAAGGEERTLLGLAGFGDLLAAITQDDRPEVALGRALARGESLEASLARLGQRVEALDLVPRVARWSSARAVRAPIFASLIDAFSSARPREAIIHELMTQPVASRDL